MTPIDARYIRRGEIAVQLVAILRVNGHPMRCTYARAATLLAVEYRHLIPMLSLREHRAWNRIQGPKDLGLKEDDWGAVVAQLRGRRRIIEDLHAGTWAEGELSAPLITDGWPERRARIVIGALKRHLSKEAL